MKLAGPAAFLLLFSITPSSSQSGAALSDVVILLQPMGESSLMAVTFSKPTSPARVKVLLGDLARRGGWKLGAVEIRDETVPNFGTAGASAHQTGASTTITGAPFMSDGGYRLQPFVEAFADYGRVELLFIENEDPAYTGLKSFTSPPLKVDLIKAGSPYRFVIQIDKSAGPLPKLPLTQPAVSPSPPAPKEPVRTRPAGNSMAYVLLVSAASGLAVFFILLLLSHLRSRRTLQSRTRRVTRP